MSSLLSAVPPYLFTQTGEFPGPFTFNVPASLEVQPTAATATFDGTGASGDFLACLSFYAQSGELLSRVYPQTPVTAGDVAEISYAPFPGGLAGGGGGPTISAWILQTAHMPGTASVYNGVEAWYAIQAGTIQFVYVSVSSAPTGSALTVRLNLNGASVGTGTVAAGTNTVTFIPSTTTFALGDVFTVDITTVGSTLPGSGVLVQLWGTY